MAPSTGNTKRPEDVVNHMFICTKEQHDKNVVLLRVNEVGVVRAWKPTSLICTVEVTSRNPPATLYVSLSHLRLGPLKVNGPLPVDFRGVISAPITRIDSYMAAPPRNDLRQHCAAVLMGIREISSRLPHLNSHHIAAMRAIEDIQATSTIINDGVMKCARRLVDTLDRKDFTINDIIRACPRVTSDNHTCGVYLRIYSDFKSAKDPRIYVGQTQDMIARARNHKYNAWNEDGGDYTSSHYVIARAAKTWTVVQLCELDPYAGGSIDAGNAIRDICEQLFVLFLNSYNPSVFADRESYDQKQLAQAISEDFEIKELAHTYRDVARLALAKTGFALPDLPNRQKAFGISYGINKKSPLCTHGYDKILWTLQDVGDRWVFQRASCQATKSRCYFAMSGPGSNPLTLTIQGSQTEPKSDDEPLPGEVYVAIWEVMKPDKGPHHAPYFRLPNIGPWNNWHYANKIAFKLCWKSKSDGCWRAKYVQLKTIPKNIDNTTPGSNRSYAMGVALYAKFTRTAWENKPVFIPHFGKADILSTRVDHFNQKIEIKLVSEPLCTLPKIMFSTEVAREKMRQLGYLENVDATWQAFDWDWLKDGKYYADGIVPKHWYGQKVRKLCDRCHLIQRKTQMSCIPVGNSRHCTHCRLQGLPCSWTKLPNLYGNEWISITAVSPTGVVYNKSLADLVQLPVVKVATKGQKIDDPGFLIVED